MDAENRLDAELKTWRVRTALTIECESEHEADSEDTAKSLGRTEARRHGNIVFETIQIKEMSGPKATVWVDSPRAPGAPSNNDILQEWRGANEKEGRKG